jgi:type II secretory pathway pseudopilin PulG
MKQLQATIQSKISLSRKQEGGFTIAEIMIAAVIIMIVLLAMAYGLTSSFKSAATVENTAKATQITNDVIAIAKQSSYRKLYLNDRAATSAALIGDGKCAVATTTPVGTVLAQTGDGAPFEGLTYCQPKRFNINGNTPQAVGATFYVQTQISFITEQNAFDSSVSTGSAVANGRYTAKRVYVTVRWQDVSSGTGAWNTVIASYTKTPSASECIPDTIILSSTSTLGSVPTAPIGAGCKP